MLWCTVAALLLCLGAVHWWPVQRDAPVRLRPTGPREVVDITVVEQTVQRARRAPPPPPIAQAPPVEVPDQVVLPEETLDLTVPEGVPESPSAGRSEAEESDGPLSSSGRPPKPVRLVEPNYTAEARENDIRARVVVEVLVDEYGQVQDQRVVRRLLLDEQTRMLEPVERIGYGLEDAALAAAQKWQFRPGRQNGTAVSAYTRVTFSFGM